MSKKDTNSTSPTSELWAHCEHLGQAVDKGDPAQTVTAVQQLILRYYDNLREQATESFESAKRCAIWICAPRVYTWICDFC